MSSTSSSTTETVMSLRIDLEHMEPLVPLVWRRILVPRDYNLKDLSVAINSAMGWSGYHMHQYSLKDPRTNKKIEISDFGPDFGDSVRLSETTKIPNIFTDSKLKVLYEHDFCSSWTHFVYWEKNVPALKGEKYPKCVGGNRIPPPEEDPGSDYSDSDVEQNFHHSKVNMSKCRQVIMGMPEGNPVTEEKIANPTAKSSEVPVVKESNSLKNELTSEKNAPAANRKMISSRSSDPSIATRQDLPNDSSSPAAKRKLIASQISAAGTVTSETIPSPVATVKGGLNGSSSSAAKNTLTAPQITAAITTTGNTISSPVATVQDMLEDTSSGIQSHMKKETDQDVEDMYGKYIASQMRLVSDLEAREDMRCDIQSIIKKYRFQKK